MASILDSLTQSLTPDTVGKIGKLVGLDPSMVTKGLGAVGPLVTGALANNPNLGQSLDGMLKGLPEGLSGGAGAGGLLSMLSGGGLSSLMGMLGGGSGGGGLLSGIFGSGLSAASGTLSKALGFNASPLIGLAAPMVLGAVKKYMTEQKVDAAGMAKVLKEEQQAFMAKGGESVKLVQQALDASKEAVAMKDKYAADKWAKIRLAPMAAAEYIMLASPSGAIGSLQEVRAAAEAISASSKDAAPTSLLSVAFSHDLTLDEAKLLTKDKGALTSLIKEAVALVAANNPLQAASYGNLLVDVATKTAEASKEGGFLGFGGTLVSPDEQAAIDDLKRMVAAK